LIIAIPTTMICWAALMIAMRRELIASDVLPARRIRWLAQLAQKPGRDLGDPAFGEVDAGLPGTWQCLDWRFLAPDPSLGAVFPLGVRPVIHRTLTTLGETVVDPDIRTTAKPLAADTVIASGARCDRQTLRSLRSILEPDGRLVIEVSSLPPSIHWRWRRWTAWRNHLRRAGFAVDDVYVVLPNLTRASAMVRLDERAALAVALRRQPVEPLKRIAARAAVTAIRLGFTEQVCRHGVISARILKDNGSEGHQ